MIIPLIDLFKKKKKKETGNETEKKYFKLYFSLDFPGLEVNVGKGEVSVSLRVSEKDYYQLNSYPLEHSFIILLVNFFALLHG